MNALSGRYFWFGLITVLVMAMSFGPSFAHVLEAPPRLAVWAPELWREATVFNGQFKLFAIAGAPLDIGAIVLGGIFSYLLGGDRAAFGFALAATILYALSLATWFAVVAPVNAELATWTRGSLPDDFTAVRDRWETGHMAVAAIKFCGLVCVITAALRMRRSHR